MWEREGRGRLPKAATDGGKKRARRCTVKQPRWTDIGREEYGRVVTRNATPSLVSDGGGGSSRQGQRFERGEGGGVT